jgi:hypothetical protein
MVDALRGETGGLVGFSVEPNHIGDSKLLEDGYVVGRSKSTVLNKRNLITPSLSCAFCEGELKAINFLGTIQFRSPF